MARSPKDEPLFSDIHRNKWNYCPENIENCAPGGLNERIQPPISPNSPVMNENMYANTNFNGDVYMNKHAYNVQAVENAACKEDKGPFGNGPTAPRTGQNYGNAMLNLGNGQLVRVFYDENNQQLIFPVSGQYELFNHNQGIHDMPLHNSQPSHLFTLNHDYSMNSNNVHVPSTSVNQTNTYQENINTQPQMPTSNFLKDLLGNLEPNSTGTYSPFGQNYPLNHPDASKINLMLSNPAVEPSSGQVKLNNSPKRNENSPLADTSNKKRIVAEVKPMRPTYSDVLAKNTKNNAPVETIRSKSKPLNSEIKPVNKTSVKPDKCNTTTKHGEEKQLKNDKKATTISSGSESGDVNTDDVEKHQKPSKKTKNKRSSMSRRWSSLDNLTNEEDTINHNNESQFVFIENQEKPVKKEKKSDPNKNKNNEKNCTTDDEIKLVDDNEQSSFYQDGQNDSVKIKKKKDARSYHKVAKPVQDKKKGTQAKVRRTKPGYLGMAQNYLEHWGGATWKALVWFFYLLSDICRMSLHLSFDLCTSVFTQTYVSSQAVWRSSKEWMSKMADNKYLLYIDRKLGHTRFGFWRKLKWFKKESEADGNGDSTKLSQNIPLPSTGEEAMKRLLACKGKDPYSILGVSVTCTDEEIKRYYRRQAFLVHPDKNQQPGTEEAFKILQHAFDLIGEPERREAYERSALESRHVEAAWSELSHLLEQLHDKMEFAANTIRCTNCGRRHKRVLTDRPCYAARYCAQCKIRHSAKEGDIWAESSMMGLLVMYYACMDGAVYQITQWASCQKKNLKQLRPDCHVVQYRIVLGNKAPAAADISSKPTINHDPNLEEFLNNLYSKSGVSGHNNGNTNDSTDAKRRRNKKPKA